LEEANAMLERLSRSHEHRPLIILAASMIEDALRSLIGSFLVPGKSKWLNRVPISQMRELALSLALIDDRESKLIAAMACLRNDFAHRWDVDSFDAPILSNNVARLREAAAYPDAGPSDLFKPMAVAIADLVVYMAYVLGTTLMMRAVEAGAERTRLDEQWPRGSPDVRNGLMIMIAGAQ